MTAPASVGPTNPVSWVAPMIRAFPAWRSSRRDQRRHDAVLGGNGETRDQPEGECEPVEHPHLHDAGQDDGGHRGGQHAAGDVGDDHHPPWREPIGHRTADQHERSAGETLEGQHDSQCEGVVAQLQDEPRGGDQGELVTQQRRRGPGQQQAEVTKRHHPPHRPGCGVGRRCWGSIRGLGRGHLLGLRLRYLRSNKRRRGQAPGWKRIAHSVSRRISDRRRPPPRRRKSSGVTPKWLGSQQRGLGELKGFGSPS